MEIMFGRKCERLEKFFTDDNAGGFGVGTLLF